MPNEVVLRFKDAAGELVAGGDLSLCAVRDDFRAIEVVDTDDPSIRLLESTSYEYRLGSSKFRLGRSDLIFPSRMVDEGYRGRIDTGIYVGLLTLRLIDAKTEREVSEAVVEIRSRKLNYEQDYRYMLEDIASRCCELLMELRAPVTQRFSPADSEEAQTLVQRLSFLKALVGSEEFQNALHRIITMPNTVWKEDVRNIPVGQSRRIGRREVRQLAKGTRRIEVPDCHPLRVQGVLKSLPERIDVRDKRDTVDTPENRFVKYALETFQKTLEEMQAKLERIGRKSDQWIVIEIQGLVDRLDERLSCGFFRDVSRPVFLPLGSPVLQRKEGYREVLRAWLQFELSARLCWRGGDDVYDAGKRDVATLYEYWVFFRLLDVVSEVFELDAPKSERLIVKTADGFGLKLKAGRHTPLRGTCRVGGRILKLKLSYNRTFARHGDGRSGVYPAKGSWTERMRPDYTLTLWPEAFSEQKAEEQELITHVHFDAKYRIERLSEVFGEDDAELKGRDLHVDLDLEARQESVGQWKRGDLLKMHAYRDAIRRTAGAYVLYPGSESKEWRGFHEIIPGLGAFPLRPMEKGDGTDELKAFLLEVAAHVSNRATQREQHTYHTYQIHKDDPPDAVHDVLPEEEAHHRTKPPKEVFVIHGWHNGDGHLDWVASKGLYNFRTEKQRGSLRLHHSVAGASYLLLHGEGEYQGGGRLFKIISDGPRVFSKEKLLELGYPGGGGQPYYLVYDVELLGCDDVLAGYDWDLSRIDGIEGGRGSPVPKRGIALSEFMKGAVLKGESR
jgi:predicted component of viral defense system (DUF524 family)